MRILIAPLLLVLLAQGCVTKAELKKDVQAWRAFHDAVSPDLTKLYEGLEEPSRSTRLKTIAEDEAAIQGAEKRAGVREDAAPVVSAK